MTQFLFFIGCVSIISFLVYGVDKYKAKHHRWRISESYLLFFGVFGGAIGAIAGMLIFHHKTKKKYFWITNILALAVHCGIFAALYAGII